MTLYFILHNIISSFTIELNTTYKIWNHLLGQSNHSVVKYCPTMVKLYNWPLPMDLSWITSIFIATHTNTDVPQWKFSGTVRLLSKYKCVRMHEDLLLCQLNPILFVWQSESAFSWPSMCVCLKAIWHMTLFIKPLYAYRLTNQEPPCSSHWTDVCLTEAARQPRTHTNTRCLFLKQNDNERNELYLDSHYPYSNYLYICMPYSLRKRLQQTKEIIKHRTVICVLPI